MHALIQVCDGKEVTSEKEIPYAELLMLRLTSSVTELVRDERVPEATLPEGSDSTRTTLSKTKATACLKVAAAVLDDEIRNQILQDTPHPRRI